MPLQFDNYNNIFPPADERDEPLSNTGVVAALSITSEFIKSIQSGTINVGTETTSTITSVDMGNSILLFNGFRSGGSGNEWDDLTVRIALTNATTVTAYRGDNDDAAYVNFVVVEFNEGIIASNQSGTITISNTSKTGTDVLTTVDTNKAIPFFLGFTNNHISTDINEADEVLPTIEITDANTITAERDIAPSLSGPDIVVGYQVVEFN